MPFGAVRGAEAVSFFFNLFYFILPEYPSEGGVGGEVTC